MWSLIHLILSNSAAGQEKGSRQASHAQVACEIIAAFEAKLPGTKEFDGAETPSGEVKREVKALAVQILKAFPSGDLEGIEPYGRPIMEAMNVRLNSLGGTHTIFTPTEEKRWSEIGVGLGMVSSSHS